MKNYFVLFYKILGFIAKTLALATNIDRFHPAKVLRSTIWVVTQHNLQSFGAKDRKIPLQPLSIFYGFFFNCPNMLI